MGLGQWIWAERSKTGGCLLTKRSALLICTKRRVKAQPHPENSRAMCHFALQNERFFSTKLGYKLKFMCTVVILRRPDHPWPLILAANRDENQGRAWRAPARHWPDRDNVVAGLDELAGGTWLGLNDYGLVACVLNRPGTLGPAPHKRSRGELPLEALDHAEASVAAEALGHLDPSAYRSFNMLIADARDAFWIAAREGERQIHVQPIEKGLSMLTAHDLNDEAGSARMRHYRPQFRAAQPPEPDSDDWQSWTRLLECRETAPDAGPESAMTIHMEDGFTTSSSSLIALRRPGLKSENSDICAIWRFRGGAPDETLWKPVDL